MLAALDDDECPLYLTERGVLYALTDGLSTTDDMQEGHRGYETNPDVYR